MSAPLVKGWCPGAYRPMMSGDGLVVRVRPWLGQLNADQVIGLCELSDQFGNGTIDLTSRANLQIRGVSETDHPALIDALQGLNLLEADPELEARRNIILTSDRQGGDLTHQLGLALLNTLKDLPELPAKMGFAIDTGLHSQLSGCSADFRFELSADGALILRADGAPCGKVISSESAMEELSKLMSWFVESGGKLNGRMSRHIRHTALPQEWQSCAPRVAGPKPTPGTTPLGPVFGAPFGQLNPRALSKLMNDSNATAMRPMPDRLFLLLDGNDASSPDFVTRPDDPTLSVHACPGAPFCPQAEAPTRDIARALASKLPDGTSLHVSGCAKGCALPRTADLTLVGANGRFNLVSEGTPWDEPSQSGLTPEMIHQQIERL
ncbi:hypothetical protein [Roseovarius aestuarii]|uniref:Ferredoxin-nitrite reductase n=1 Tax=Roseovarius aestuarii TaxID=475083 RepID=A0A1X7BR51_9RHOB|nr:hypothetical protein [Roseovarius aestuarii]SMC12053.1 ferredoxin-nitrite reductase [Roseovarius aestuarii]